MDAGYTIFKAAFYESKSLYTTYGFIGKVLDRYADELRRSPQTINDWIDAALVRHDLEQRNIRSTGNLSMTAHLKLKRLDAEPEIQAKLAERAIEPTKRDGAKQGNPRRWTIATLSHEVDQALAKAGLPVRKKGRRKGSGQAGGNTVESESLGPECTAEDRQEIDAVVHRLMERRRVEDRPKFLAALVEWIPGWYGALDLATKPHTRSTARVSRELARLWNTENSKRPSGERAPRFEAKLAPGGLVEVRQGNWHRCCKLEILVAHLQNVSAAVETPAGQILMAEGRVDGTMADKLREVRAAVQAAAEETWARPTDTGE